LAKQIPGLRSYMLSRGEVTGPEGPAAYHLVGQLDFDSMSDLQAALASPEGVASAGDLQNFATGGATLIWHDVNDA
jgi:uncharacterized protein (TIGR02118 family)